MHDRTDIPKEPPDLVVTRIGGTKSLGAGFIRANYPGVDPEGRTVGWKDFARKIQGTDGLVVIFVAEARWSPWSHKVGDYRHLIEEHNVTLYETNEF